MLICAQFEHLSGESALIVRIERVCEWEWVFRSARNLFSRFARHPEAADGFDDCVHEMLIELRIEQAQHL